MITVSATLEGQLRIVVRNTGAPLGTAAASGFGVGLDNVRRRLHHYYGREASLAVTFDASGATVAELQLPAADSDDQNVELMARRVAR
jgi:LytS/YehU family sensor histidine kinase